MLGTQNVGRLTVKWSRGFAGYLTSTPAVADGTIYLPDRNGMLWALSADTGTVRWSNSVGSYTGVDGDVVHATPAVADGRVIVGDQPKPSSRHPGASIFAVDARTGRLLWRTVVDRNPQAKITGAAAVDAGTVYVGVSSNDESNAHCCSFRGNMVALDATTGKIKWRTYTVPPGYTGASVWSGSPVIDHATGMLYIGTGNNYSVPKGICATPTERSCHAPPADDHFDSLLGLDLRNGMLVWALRTFPADADTIACRNSATCGPDYGFGSAPNLLDTTVSGDARTLVGIGGKNGIYYAADGRTGRLVWKTQVGPPGDEGGIQWGSAFDGRRIYISINNSDHAWFGLQPSGEEVDGGAVAALDPASGRVLWQTADPEGAGDLGFVSTANGVVYAGSTAVAGDDMFALRADNGKIVWKFASGGSVMGGAAIVDGIVYWPTGYYTLTCPNDETRCGETKRLYAFAVHESR